MLSESNSSTSLRSDTYEIFFGPAATHLGSLIKKNKFSTVFFLVDDNTLRDCLPHLKQEGIEVNTAHVLCIKPGEENKNLENCALIWSFLHENRADRNSLLVNVGGGVLTDMGAFSASVYKRGISFIQIPTSLLAQVDASVGGKTGIDFKGEKNMIGTFAQPLSVIIDERFLQTLHPEQLLSGTAEMIKHGLISDQLYYQQITTQIKSCLDKHAVPLELILRSVRLKNEVVLADPLEKGLRKILNFGHTAGHAIESYSFNPGLRALSHGEAIGVGMICELYLSSLVAGLPSHDRDKISSFLFSLFGKSPIDTASYSDLYQLMLNDKKNLSGQINFSLITEIGRCGYDYAASQEQIFNSFDYFNNYFV